MAPRVGRRRTAKRDAEEETQDGESGFGTALSLRLNKKFGSDTVVDPDEDDRLFANVKEYVSTQCFGLNYAMHLPGVAVGRLITIRGDFMTGKTTIAAHIMAEAQQMGGFACYIDTEYAFDKKHFIAMGVDLSAKKWLMPQVDTVEEAIGVIDELVDTAREEQDKGNNRLVVIVWDSVGATATKSELSEDFGSARPGQHARLLSAALRRITKKIAEYRILLVFTAQEKDRVDFFSMGKDVKTIMAEKPIMFHSTIVLRPKHIKTLYDGKKEPLGIRVQIIVRKNKLAAPFSKADCTIHFNKRASDGRAGLDDIGSRLAVALQRGLVKKSTSWYSYEGVKFQENNFGKVIEAHPEIMEKLDFALANYGHSEPRLDEDVDIEMEDQGEEEEDEEEAED